MKIHPLLLTDFYKVDHKSQYPEGTELVYSNFTPRKSRIAGVDGVVVFGLQYFIKEFLINRFDNFFKMTREEAVSSYKRVLDNSLGKDSVNVDNVGELWDLKYLPLKIKALPEGTVCPIKVPCLTIVNTLPKFYWLTNFVESILSTTIWGAMTSATLAREYRLILDAYAKSTGGDPAFVPWQAHDFSLRGLWCSEAAAVSGAAHLLSFTGTDSIPSICFLEEYYNANSDTELIGGSVPATEHSVQASCGRDGEPEIYKRLINEVYPSGIVSIVSDTYDLWNVLTVILPSLKSDIIARNGKVVVRPDSGDPADILCGVNIYDFEDRCSTISYWKECTEKTDLFFHEGELWECDIKRFNDFLEEYGWDTTYQTFQEENLNDIEASTGGVIYRSKVKISEAQKKGVIELLWDEFGGTVNAEGYKVLDPHVGAIYGDSITPTRCKDILSRLKDKGFASTNVVLGVGSYTYQYNTRDTFGFAMKATYCEVNGEGREIFKDPVTDDGTKKSLKGLLKVYKEDGVLKVKDKVSWDEEAQGELQTVFEDGRLLKDFTLAEVRKNVLESL